MTKNASIDDIQHGKEELPGLTYYSPGINFVGREGTLVFLSSIFALKWPSITAFSYLGLQSARMATGQINASRSNRKTVDKPGGLHAVASSTSIRILEPVDELPIKNPESKKKKGKLFGKAVGAVAVSAMLFGGGAFKMLYNLYFEEEKVNIDKPPLDSKQDQSGCPIFTPIPFEGGFTAEEQTAYSEGVIALQSILADNGFYKKKIDGKFGEFSQRALVGLESQLSENGIAVTVDGVFTEADCNAING